MPPCYSNSGGRSKFGGGTPPGRGSSVNTQNLPYTGIIGSLPDPRDVAIFTAYNRLLNARLANVPAARATTYYFATAGSDSGAGTQADPFQTLGKLQDVLTNTVGPVACLLNRGDTFREDQLILATDHQSIGAYGSGALPLLTRCTLQYTAGGGGWTSDTTAYYRSEAASVACVIVTGAKLTRPLTIAQSVADCKATDDSWFWDPSSNRLYVRLYNGILQDPNTVSLEACTGNTYAYHVEAFGNDIRIDDLRLEGYGIRPTFGTNITFTNITDNGSGAARVTATAHGKSTGDRVFVYGVGGTTAVNNLPFAITVINANTFDLQGSTFNSSYTSGGTIKFFSPIQTYGLALRPQDTTEECVSEGCEIYFTGYHALGVLSSSGGFGTVKDFTSGYCRPGPGGDATNVVGFSSTGGQETIWENLTSVAGNLFENGLGSSSGRVTTGVYGHTASGTNTLAILRGHTVTPGAWAIRFGAYFANLPTAATITDARGLIIDEVIDDSAQPSTRLTTIDPLPSNQVRINCLYWLWADTSSVKSVGGAGSGWSINLDCVGYGSSGAHSLFKAMSDGGFFYYARLRLYGYGALFSAAVDAADFDGVGGDSCLLECVNPDRINSATSVNASNAAAAFDYCGWHARDPVPAYAFGTPAGTAGLGAIGGTGKVAVPAPRHETYDAPDADSVLAGGGNPAILVNYDFNRAARTVSTIGPLNASATSRAAINTLSSVIGWWKKGDWYTDAGKTTLATSAGQSVAVWAATVGTDWTQSTGANQPTTATGLSGILGGANKYMTGTLGALSTFTVYAVCKRTTATIGTIFGKVGGTATGQYAGVYSDNNAYLITDAGGSGVQSAAAAALTGTYLVRFARVPNNCYVTGTLLDEGTASPAVAGNCTFDALFARTGAGGEYSHSAFELTEIVLASSDTRGGDDERVILDDLYARLGVLML